MSLKNIKTRQQLVAEQAAEAAEAAQARRLQERTAPSALVPTLDALEARVAELEARVNVLDPGSAPVRGGNPV